MAADFHHEDPAAINHCPSPHLHNLSEIVSLQNIAATNIAYFYWIVSVDSLRRIIQPSDLHPFKNSAPNIDKTGR